MANIVRANTIIQIPRQTAKESKGERKRKTKQKYLLSGR
jgi:hypothetical protein